jgi:DNA invertase Pin-like site-specific DNA recombinase
MVRNTNRMLQLNQPTSIETQRDYSMANAVAYYRVSTDRQGRSGLGLEAQRSAVIECVRARGWTLQSEFTEVESGKRNDRPALLQALSECRLQRATLFIAKLDRLSRDAHFLLGLDKAGVEFLAVDMPNANRLTVGIMALVAEEERRMISARTKAALAAAKARGVKLGGYRVSTVSDAARIRSAQMRRTAADDLGRLVRPVIEEFRTLGIVSLRAIARALNDRGIRTRTGGAWDASGVKRVLDRT